MTETVSEKVIRLETQVQNITGEIAEVKSLVKEVIVKVDNFTNIQTEVANLKIEIARLQRRASLNSFLIPTSSAIVGGVLMVLVLSFLGRLAK